MRKSKTLTLLLALLVAGTALTGCLGGSDDGDDASGGADDGSGTGTGDGTGTDDGSGTSTGDGTDAGGNSTGTDGAGGADAPKPNDVNETLTLTMGAGINAVPESPSPAYGEVGFSVPETGWRTFTVTITPQSVHADNVKVTVLDPEDGEQGSASFAFSAEEGAPREITVTGGAAGEWKITAEAGALGQEAKFDVQVTVAY